MGAVLSVDLTNYEMAYLMAKVIVLGLVLFGCWWVDHIHSHHPGASEGK
jgi:hypothetical protein